MVEAGTKAIVTAKFAPHTWERMSETMREDFRKDFIIGLSAALACQPRPTIREVLRLTPAERKAIGHDGY